MLTGRRYLLDLSPEQARYAEQVSGACRAVWNTGLEQRRVYAQRYLRSDLGVFPSYALQCRELAEAKADHSWLADAPGHTLQQTLKDLDKACRTHGTFSVRWRSKAKTSPSFRFPDPKQVAVRRLNRRWGEVKLPKFGWVRFRWTRAIGGTIRNATVSRNAGRWYISFCVEDGVVETAPNGQPAVGVDLGVNVAVATSEGEMLHRETVTVGEAKRLKRLQQLLSRSLRIHGHNRRSKRREVARAQFGRLNARIRARRNDFAAQTAVRLVRNHGLIAVENLRIKSMTASAKGTIEAPSRNVRQKAGLNRAILDKGWGGFLLKLEHAARYHGATVVKVSPAYTSQTCNACKHVARESRESQAVFRCVACGHQDHADVNAAKNIRERGIELASAAGLAVAGRGDLGNGRSAKRQPPVKAAA